MQKEIRHTQKNIWGRNESEIKGTYERTKKKNRTSNPRAVGGPVHLYRAVDVRVPTGHQADDLRGDTSRGG